MKCRPLYYISLPICSCQRPCLLCLSKCVWQECMAHIRYLIRQESWLLPPCFSRFSNSWHQSYVTTLSFFELWLISADRRGPAENFLHVLQHEYMQYFIYDLFLYVVTKHTVERRKHCCQGGLYSSVWKLSLTKHRFTMLPSDSWSIMCYILPSVMALYRCFGKEEKVFKGSVWFWSIVKAGGS